MTIASPHLVQLHAPLGWPPSHLDGMTDGLATRWCSRNRTQITGSEPRVQLAITPDGRVDPWVFRRPFCPLASPASPISDHRAVRHAGWLCIATASRTRASGSLVGRLPL